MHEPSAACSNSPATHTAAEGAHRRSGGERGEQLREQLEGGRVDETVSLRTPAVHERLQRLHVHRQQRARVALHHEDRLYWTRAESCSTTHCGGLTACMRDSLSLIYLTHLTMASSCRTSAPMKAASFSKGASLRAAARPAAPLRKVAVTASLGKQVRLLPTTLRRTLR